MPTHPSHCRDHLAPALKTHTGVSLHNQFWVIGRMGGIHHCHPLPELAHIGSTAIKHQTAARCHLGERIPSDFYLLPG